MTLKLIRQFITDNAKRLSSQLSDFENNVQAETLNIRSTFVVAPVAVRVNAGGGIYTTGQALLCDTSSAAFGVLVSAKKNVPGFLVLINKGPNAVTVRPLSGSIDQGSSISVASGNALIYFDGADWWRL